MSKLIVANLKMNLLSPLEREGYLNAFKKEIKNKKFDKTEIVLCPPFIHIENFLKVIGKRAKVGVQNMFWERQGAFTGEISPAMLKNFGGEYVILGHSDRRRYFGETDEEINLKVNSALKIGLKPIICVGESEQSGRGMQIVMNQLRNCLADIQGAKIENVVICYEPVWAISSNHPDHMPTTNEIMSARLLIKKFLVEKYGARSAEKVRIIYGGSVDAKTAQEVCVDPGMAGALVGKASLTPYEFIKIAEIINE